MLSSQSTRTTCAVALPAEGVDRNTVTGIPLLKSSVALPAEGVDRNKEIGKRGGEAPESPFPRRAWIEIRFPIINRRVGSSRPPRGGRG